jgi:osmotically-inducible protein OsmY
MKLSRLAYIAAVSAALGTTIIATGCASTPTQSSTGEVIDDSVITTKVKAALVEDKQVSALDISVETFKGTVQLSGFAGNESEVARAVQLASGQGRNREERHSPEGRLNAAPLRGEPTARAR